MTNADFTIDRWTSAFVSRDTEAAFRKFIYAGNLRNNYIALTIGLITHGLYGVLDILNFGPAASEGMIIRLTSVFAGFALLGVMRFGGLERHHESFAAIITVIVGLSINGIIFFVTDLNNGYYVAFIQTGVFACCLIRIGFVKPVAVLATFLAGFIFVSLKKGPYDEALLQIYILLSMSVILGFAAYLLQRYRRQDFIKSQIIEMQNQRLSEMLADTRRDNERKVAALNILLHIVRTPVHQISGFADLVMSQLKDAENEAPVGDCLESARYIKTASDDLRAGVSKLLRYHQLDEAWRSPEIEALPVLELLQDATAHLPENVEVAITGNVKTVNADRRVIEAVVENIVQNLTWVETETPKLEIDVSEDDDNVVFTFRDNGGGIPEDVFARATRPLTEIKNYLSGDGGNLTMGLRTAARAIDIAGGQLDYRRQDGAVITIAFPRIALAGGKQGARCAA